MTLQTDLEFLESQSLLKEEENERFKSYLRNINSDVVDLLVQALNADIEPRIDCTTCGNCCRKLMININDAEIETMAGGLGISAEAFTSQYVQEGSSMKIMNAIPCPFLGDNKCTAYDCRPGGCREFPKLDEPGFTGRMFGTFTHYGMCPIIFNVVEQLKWQTGFLVADEAFHI